VRDRCGNCILKCWCGWGALAVWESPWCICITGCMSWTNKSMLIIMRDVDDFEVIDLSIWSGCYGELSYQDEWRDTCVKLGFREVGSDRCCSSSWVLVKIQLRSQWWLAYRMLASLSCCYRSCTHLLWWPSSTTWDCYLLEPYLWCMELWHISLAGVTIPVNWWYQTELSGRWMEVMIAVCWWNSP